MNINVTKHSGFTILEMMVAVGLLAVIMSLAVPSFTDFTERQAVKADITRFTKIFTTARAIAMTANDAASVVCWNTTDNNATIQTVPVPARTMVAYAGTRSALGQLESVQSFAENQLVYRLSETDGCIGFDSQGRLSDSVATAAVPLTLLVCRSADNATDSIRLEVSVTGRILSRPNDSIRGAGVQSCTS